MFYEKCRRDYLDTKRLHAITLAQALVYTNPSSDRSYIHKKQKMWEKFINSLDYDKLIAREKRRKDQDYNQIVKTFRMLNIPVQTKDVK